MRAIGFIMALCMTLALSLRSEQASGCNMTRSGNALTLDLSDTSVAFPEIRSQLDRGLTVTVFHLVEGDGAELSSLGCRIYYDLWDEAYTIESFTPGGNKVIKEKDTSALKRLCYTLDMKVHPGQLEVRTVLDPISDEQLEKTRQWLAERGIGETSGAFLGRAVGAFVDLKQKKMLSRTCALSGSSSR